VRIAVLDGQGGGIGAQLVKALAALEDDRIEILALGTNAVAAANMLRNGANRGASGANAVKVTLEKADIVTGPVTICFANSMMGEVTPEIAAAVSSCSALKLLLPLRVPGVIQVGIEREPLPLLIERTVQKIKELLRTGD
jgi:NAD(P)-dependent dehydrogenase (short-subunit alcohol dehydrogenase family)